MSQFFEITSIDGGGRAGIMRTAHGEVQTPVFMPVATKGCVKLSDPVELQGFGAQALISNAYHLYLRPGIEIIRKAGGLHKFMGWDRTIFTDSGGFQMIRSGFDSRVSGDFVEFKSPFDGTVHRLTPEKCIEIQSALGSDVAMVLDHCPAHDASQDAVKDATERTVKWAERCKKAWFEIRESRAVNRKSQVADSELFAIAQGGTSPELRRWCMEKLEALDFPGYGIGGLCIGEKKEDMWKAVDATMPLMPAGKPRYLMGVGAPDDILNAVERGIDVFDSVFPTRNARHGTIWTSQGRINLDRREFLEDFRPLDSECKCPVCRSHSRAYVSHLLRVGEMEGMRLATIHNLYFTINLINELKIALRENRFSSFKVEMLGKWEI